MTPSLLIVISAPSGGGKTTVCQRLLAGDPRLTRAVTCTTRPPRPGERDGSDYHFLTTTEFVNRATAGAFLEHAEVHGQRYGTLRAEVTDRLRGGQDVLLNIDVQGATQIRSMAKADPELRQALVTVFLTPPTIAILEQRLRGRQTEDEEAVRRRLARARQEVAHWAEFDYLLLSGTIAEDVERMQTILEAERMRSLRLDGWTVMES
jgi:guanylate kinase